jgi:hypothetical protein
MTRRYAEFAFSVLSLNENHEDAILSNSLLRLRCEIENLIFRLAKEIPERKSQIIFFINNYDLVLTILNVR